MIPCSLADVPSHRRASAADRRRWDDLHAAYAAARAAADDYESQLRSGRYGWGDPNWRSWITKTERGKLERLEAKADKIGDKIVELLVRVSPRGEAWLSGAPAWWIHDRLTWEDAIRPESEPLSVVVPAPWGRSEGLREAHSETHWETRGVLAGAYANRNPKSLLTHSVEVDAQGNEIRVFCGRVELDHVADPHSGDVTARPTCPICARYFDSTHHGEFRENSAIAWEGTVRPEIESLSVVMPAWGSATLVRASGSGLQWEKGGSTRLPIYWATSVGGDALTGEDTTYQIYTEAGLWRLGGENVHHAGVGTIAFHSVAAAKAFAKSVDAAARRAFAGGYSLTPDLLAPPRLKEMTPSADWEDYLAPGETRYIPAVVRPQMPDVIARAMAAGMPSGTEYVGAGMTGVVFCAGDTAFKVARDTREIDHQMFDEEAEWLASASVVPAVASHVARFWRFDPENLVIVRDCPHPDPDQSLWRWESRLHELHGAIERSMLPHGWTAPEFKPDSYVLTPRGPVLVDASMPSRVGAVLAQYVEDVVSGARPLWTERPHDLTFYVRREVGQTLTQAEADHLQTILERRWPEARW